MALCPGKRAKKVGSCGSILFRCKKCGNVGCQQAQGGDCSNQGFSASSKCLRCGILGQKEILK